MDLISVAVITYNSSETVIETLESIKQQTYPLLELVVSDDCSNDDTMAKVKEWADLNKKRFHSIRLTERKKNVGVVINCNKGIRKCNGKYVQIIAGDDLLPACAIEEKYRFAEKNRLQIVITMVKPFGKNKIRTQMMKQHYEASYRLLDENRREQLRKNLSANYIIGPMYSFYRKDFWIKMGGYDQRYPMDEDWPFTIKLLQTDVPLILLEKELYEYRVSSTSLSNSTNNAVLRESNKKLIFNVNIWLLLKNGWFKDAFLLLAALYHK